MIHTELAVLQPYCENDMKLLKKISRSIFMRFDEPLSEADYDDFYSIANMTLWQAYNAYDSNMGVSFDGFLNSCLKKKFATEIQKRHRHKRVLNQFAVSLDAINENSGDCCILDFLASDFDTFEEAVKEQTTEQYQDKVQQYISKLSTKQINILNLLIDGYEPHEIQELLGIPKKEYMEHLRIMRSYEKIKILF